MCGGLLDLGKGRSQVLGQADAESQGGEPVEVGLVLCVPGSPSSFGWTKVVALALELAEVVLLGVHLAVEVVQAFLEDGSMLTVCRVNNVP